MKSLFVFLILIAGLSLVTGCGPSESEVSGTVFLDSDDKPLPEGDIIFEDVDKKITPGAGKITDGKYSVKVLPGSKIVRISAARPTGKSDKVMGTAEREPMLGEEFNMKSTLKADIKGGKQEGVNFKVKSLPK